MTRPHSCPQRALGMILRPQLRLFVMQCDGQTESSSAVMLYGYSVTFRETASPRSVFLHTQEVAGSSPAAPTTSFSKLASPKRQLFRSCPHECTHRRPESVFQCSRGRLPKGVSQAPSPPCNTIPSIVTRLCKSLPSLIASTSDNRAEYVPRFRRCKDFLATMGSTPNRSGVSPCVRRALPRWRSRYRFEKNLGLENCTLQGLVGEGR